TGMSTEQDKARIRRERLKELVDAPVPEQFERVASDVREMGELVKQEMAERLTPAFNAHLHASPQKTFEEKKQLCRWANHFLREMSLSVECPTTHRPTILVAYGSSPPGIGRFQLVATLPDGRRERTLIARSLPYLDLCPDHPREEGTSRYHPRASPRG